MMKQTISRTITSLYIIAGLYEVCLALIDIIIAIVVYKFMSRRRGNGKRISRNVKG